MHVFSPCPTGWKFAPDQSIEVAKRAVASNMFPIWEKENGKFKLNINRNPISVSDFIQGIGKFSKLTADEIDAIQAMVDRRYRTLLHLAGE